jgi:hypothetical protein
MQTQSNSIFRKFPEKSLVEEILVKLNFLGFHDTKYFSKQDISDREFEEVCILIESYYIPCKAKKFLNVNNKITVLRQLLHCVGYTLESQEKVFNSKKTIVYTIKKTILDDLSGNYIVSFN